MFKTHILLEYIILAGVGTFCLNYTLLSGVGTLSYPFKNLLPISHKDKNVNGGKFWELPCVLLFTLSYRTVLGLRQLLFSRFIVLRSTYLNEKNGHMPLLLLQNHDLMLVIKPKILEMLPTQMDLSHQNP